MMHLHPQASLLLVTGGVQPSMVNPVARCARAAGLDCTVRPGERASQWDSGGPGAIIVDLRTPATQPACVELRTDIRFASAPLIAVTQHVDDLMFPEVYSWGGDDVVAADQLESLVPRLRSLTAAPHGATVPRGVALVAGNDPLRRAVLGRTLRNAGYAVRFAAELDDVGATSVAERASLVVVDADVAPDGALAAAARARADGCAAPWVLLARPRDVGRIALAARRLDRVGVTDAFAPPESAIFVANEIARSERFDARASQRVLYSTAVSFRIAGRESDMVGCSYNLSAGGLYVRTLAPPPAGESVWVEFRPPRSRERVRLEGRVAWTRAFGPNEPAIAPPGFGVQILDGSSTDLARWRRGYEALAHDEMLS